MYYVYILVCVAVIIGPVYSAVAIHLPAVKPVEMAEQVGCYVPALNVVLPYNKPYSPQDGIRCVQYHCRKDNLTSIFSCGAAAVHEGCAIVSGNKNLPYPDCCDKPTCNIINHNSIVT